MSGTSEANPAAFRMSEVPHGQSWHCFWERDRFDPNNRAAGCYRSESACEQYRSEREENASETTEITACREQAKSAALTYFNVMHDKWRFWALPTLGGVRIH
jgi:hypothetical protein